MLHHPMFMCILVTVPLLPHGKGKLTEHYPPSGGLVGKRRNPMVLIQYAFIAIAFATLSIAAQLEIPMDLHGKVVDSLDYPLSGVEAHLLEADISDTSDEQGNFQFVSSTSIKRFSSAFKDFQPYVRQNTLFFSVLSAVDHVSAELFSLNGKKIKTIFSKDLQKGYYSFRPLPDQAVKIPASMYLIKLQCGNSVTSHAFFYPFKGSSVRNGTMKQEDPSTVELDKKQDLVDILYLKETGYRPDSMYLTSYSGSLPTFKLNSTANQLLVFLLKDNEISEWISDTTNGIHHTGWDLVSNETELSWVIDGGYFTYSEHGFVNGLMQWMLSDSNASLWLDAFNFQTSDSATAMYNNQKSLSPSENILQIGSYAQSIVCGFSYMLDPTQSEINVYAHKANIYFELDFSGFNSETKAMATAKVFIDWYFSKIVN